MRSNDPFNINFGVSKQISSLFLENFKIFYTILSLLQIHNNNYQANTLYMYIYYIYNTIYLNFSLIHLENVDPDFDLKKMSTS